ncbi:MAG: ATP-binding cassette domain-containing protein, partial [Mucinivorans sp.]
MQLSRELLKIKDLSVCYGATEALNGVNLVVCSDDFIGVIGPNGGGKSTLVKAILGLVHCSSGTIEFVKNELRIGYLPQSNTIDRQFPINVRDVILSGSRQKRTAALRDRLEQLLAQIAIKPLVRRSISALSGGQ